MSRKRDTNWSRDEITVLLDSILDITRTRADDGKRTNSREVFEYAAKKMGEKGHTSRAEREKCRTKWKKMKEEFTHAKKAREGDPRFKEAPGIQPFYDRMEEFTNGNFDNISPHSTIVRRTSSRPSSGMRTSARIAANTNGTNTNASTNSSNDNNDTSSTIVIKSTNSTDFPTAIHTLSNNSPSSPRQNSRLSSGSNNNTNNNDNSTANSNGSSAAMRSKTSLSTSHQQLSITNGDSCTMYTSYNNCGGTNNNNTSLNTSNNMLAINPSNPQTTEHADISYRVGTGCRQITIFGDHDVDIKFRGDCVTINKINADYSTSET